MVSTLLELSHAAKSVRRFSERWHRAAPGHAGDLSPGVWIGLNLLFGATALSGILGVAVQVAWEAHLGGFLFGLLVFGLFDPLRWSPSGGPGNVGYGEWLGDQGGDDYR